MIRVDKARWRWLPERLARWRAPVVCLLLGHLVFAGMVGLWQAGMLQALELLGYDQGLRWQALAPLDERIVLIGETEADIHRWGYPLPDGVLAEALERLAQGRPRVIGVDKYRDIPVPPGSERLDQVLRRHPEIVWVTKFGNFAAHDPAVAPPPLWRTPIGRASAIFPSTDGLTRRGLLFLDDGRQVSTAFALVMALRYLRPERIVPQGDSQHADHLRLGATTIPPLETDAGAYVRADTAGYQYLLDYRSRLSAARIFTLTDLLQGRLPAVQPADKIVLLGGMAESLRDDFQIPPIVFWPMRRRFQYQRAAPTDGSPGRAPRPAGRSATAVRLGGRFPIRGLPDFAEAGWLWLWCLAGVGLALSRVHFQRLLTLMAGALILLAGIWRIVSCIKSGCHWSRRYWG